MFGSNMARKVPAVAANDPDAARFAVWYDVLGRREVEFGDVPVRVEVYSGEETTEIFVEMVFETLPGRISEKTGRHGCQQGICLLQRAGP
jgi:hypothetical protein